MHEERVKERRRWNETIQNIKGFIYFTDHYFYYETYSLLWSGNVSLLL